MRRNMKFLLLALLVLPFSVQAGDLQVMAAGKYDMTSENGGLEIGGIYDIGDRFFVVGEVNAGQAKNGAAGMLGVKVFEGEKLTVGLLGGPATQWYALTNEATAAKTNYVEGATGAFVSFELGEAAPKLFLAYTFTDPEWLGAKDAVAIEAEHTIGLGLTFPIKIE